MTELWGLFSSLMSVQSVVNSGIFDTLYTTLMTEFLVPISQQFTDVINFIQPIFTFTFGLFVAFFGYLILAGKIKAPAQEFVWRVTTITIIIFLALRPAFYESMVVRPVMGVTTGLTKLFSPNFDKGIFVNLNKATKVGQQNESVFNNNRGIFIGLDAAIESVGIILSGTVNAYQSVSKAEFKPPVSGSGSGTGTGTGTGQQQNKNTMKKVDLGMMTVMLLMGFIGLIITGAVMVFVTAGAILMINHAFLVLMLMIGPIFLCFAAYKPTREYAKRWLSRVMSIMLTIAIVSAVTAFILLIQKDIATQMCKSTAALQRYLYVSFDTQSQSSSGSNATREEVKRKMEEAFTLLETRIGTAAAFNWLSNDFNNSSQHSAQAALGIQVVEDIKTGCFAQSTNSSAGTDADNILFYAIQYLIICMILNRLLTESANIAAAIMNSSGLTTGSSQEVSGGAQGVTGRAQNAGGKLSTKAGGDV